MNSTLIPFLNEIKEEKFINEEKCQEKKTVMDESVGREKKNIYNFLRKKKKKKLYETYF